MTGSDKRRERNRSRRQALKDAQKIVAELQRTRPELVEELRSGGLSVPEPPQPKRSERPKRLSRAQRWSQAVSKAVEGLNELVDLQSEYSDWCNNLPDSLQQSATADKLNEIINLDLEGAKDTLEEAEGADLPLGFGRD